MGLFPTHFDRKFVKIIKNITIFLAPYFGPYFPFVGLTYLSRATPGHESGMLVERDKLPTPQK